MSRMVQIKIWGSDAARLRAAMLTQINALAEKAEDAQLTAANLKYWKKYEMECRALDIRNERRRVMDLYVELFGRENRDARKTRGLRRRENLAADTAAAAAAAKAAKDAKDAWEAAAAAETAPAYAAARRAARRGDALAEQLAYL